MLFHQLCHDVSETFLHLTSQHLTSSIFLQAQHHHHETTMGSEIKETNKNEAQHRIQNESTDLLNVGQFSVVFEEEFQVHHRNVHRDIGSILFLFFASLFSTGKGMAVDLG